MTRFLFGIFVFDRKASVKCRDTIHDIKITEFKLKKNY